MCRHSVSPDCSSPGYAASIEARRLRHDPRLRGSETTGGLWPTTVMTSNSHDEGQRRMCGHGAQALELLFIVKRSRFARGAADHKALDSGRGKRASQRGEATVVNFATAKRRDQGNPQAAELSLRGSGHDVSFREVWTESSAVERQALQKDLGFSCSVASLTTEPPLRSGERRFGFDARELARLGDVPRQEGREHHGLHALIIVRPPLGAV